MWAHDRLRLRRAVCRDAQSITAATSGNDILDALGPAVHQRFRARTRSSLKWPLWSAAPRFSRERISHGR